MSWYVIHTKPRFEKKVATALERKGFEVYLPLRKIVKQWSDRKKKIQEPLIKSYVFINMEAKGREQSLTTPGVVRFLFWLGKPAVVKQQEIDAMRQFLGELDYLPEKSWYYLSEGDKLEVESGVFKKKTGAFIARQGNNILLNINSLGQVIRVQIPIQHLSLD